MEEVNKKEFEKKVQDWVSGMNSFSVRMIELFQKAEAEVQELTPISKGSDILWDGEYWEVEKVDGDRLILKDTNLICDKSEATLAVESFLPSWGTVWQLSSSWEEDWVLENLEDVAEVGFRIFFIEELQMLFLGIDGGGYDFYEQHWEPLYKLRYPF